MRATAQTRPEPPEPSCASSKNGPRRWPGASGSQNAGCAIGKVTDLSGLSGWVVESGPSMLESSSPDPFHPGSRLGPYTLLCRIQVGGMGTVWAAALTGERGFSKLVAIKTILHELSDEVQYVRALRDEAQLAASIYHPHVCDVTELGEAFGYPFLVMEWVDGASLAELLGGSAAPTHWQPLDPLVA